MMIRKYEAGDREGVVSLILPIQREEFGVPITLEDQPDLLEIEAFYRTGAGDFWVAADEEGAIIGTVALLDIGNGSAALRKMFVAPPYRGRASGTAAALLGAALDWARAQGVTDVYLGTTPAFLAAHRFYEKHGFRRVEPETLPASFPRLAVDKLFFHRPLAG